MSSRWTRARSATGLFTVYATVTLILVVLLGAALALAVRNEAEERGLAEGRSEALLVARTAIEHHLDGRPLADGLNAEETAELTSLTQHAIAGGNVLRVRLRNLDGHVIFSDDGSGGRSPVDEEVARAAAGEVVALVTRLNTDANDVGPVGAEAVEVYAPLIAGDPGRQVGVLELYLPYAPIAEDISRGTNQLYLVLAVGLLLLYVALFLVTLSVTRRLRRQVTENQYMAEHDVLTGLPNRMVFKRSLDEHLHERAGDGDAAIVAIVDLDRFKIINDTLGHSVGDALLLRMGERLRRSVRPGSTVARLGGDEFGILLVGEPDAQGALRRVKEVLEQEIEIDDLPKVTVDCSVGYALAGIDGGTTELLLQRAEIAMYFAKQHHVGVFHYDAAHDRHDPAQLALVGEMRRAIDNDELVVHYQPKVHLADGQVRALEALVRWQHPRLGLIQPDDFIALVEETELIHDLTVWVLTKALGDLASLGPVADDLTIAVNVSARNLSRPDFPTRVADAIAASDVPATRLSIEITETALLTSPERALDMLQAIAAQGVQISLDDFGVGQTSLSYIASMPISEVKVDRSFVTDMTTDRVHGIIVGSIIELAHGLRMRVVAEGVETQADAITLASMGCDLAQGSLYSPPLAYDTLRFWLTQRQPRSDA